MATVKRVLELQKELNEIRVNYSEIKVENEDVLYTLEFNKILDKTWDIGLNLGLGYTNKENTIKLSNASNELDWLVNFGEWNKSTAKYYNVTTFTKMFKLWKETFLEINKLVENY